MLNQVQSEGAVVPALWMLEVANVPLMAARRGPVARESMQERLAMLDMLGIETAAQAIGAAWRNSVLSLAQTRGLIFYDAIYPELAIRRGMSLASSDKALRRAAIQCGVSVEPVELP
jgi:predicted nucleic acid-binding protein